LDYISSIVPQMTSSTEAVQDMPAIALPAPLMAPGSAAPMAPPSSPASLAPLNNDQEEEIDSEEDDVQEDAGSEIAEQDDDMTRWGAFFRKLWYDLCDHHVLAATFFVLGTIAQTGLPSWQTIAIAWHMCVLTTILCGVGFGAGVMATSQSHFIVYITKYLSVWLRLPYTLRLVETPLILHDSLVT